MILDIVQTTKNEILTYRQALNQQNQIQDLRNTHDELAIIQRTFLRVSVAFELLYPFLKTIELSSIADQIKSIRLYLQDSRQDFADNSNYKQAPSIGRIGSMVNSLVKILEQIWSIHAQNQFQSYAELAKIAKSLPRMQKYGNDIDLLLNNLNHASRSLPDRKKWSDFQTKLNELSTLLDSIEGLPSEKITFLNKIRNHGATLSDFTPELLKWCADMGLDESLSVRFKNDAN